MSMSLRKVLNLTYAWIVDLIGGSDDWDRDFAPIFAEHEHEDFDYVDLEQVLGRGGSGLALDGG